VKGSSCVCVCVRGCEWDDDSVFLFLFSSSEFFFLTLAIRSLNFEAPPFGKDRISYGVLADLLL
jgi:hypothetical protein